MMQLFFYKNTHKKNWHNNSHLVSERCVIISHIYIWRPYDMNMITTLSPFTEFTVNHLNLIRKHR